jgi:putative membrane protein
MIIKLIIRVLVIAGTLLLLPHFIPGIAVAGLYTALVVAVLWGMIMLLVKPVLALLTLPINLLTLGLFSFVLNALLFWFLTTFVAGFTVAGFLPALLGSLTLVVVGWLLHALIS